MIIENIRFLSLASTDNIWTPLKSFTDSILFYYLGQQALKKDGELAEIGCGGSTYVLYELSENNKRTFNFCDLKSIFIDAHKTHYANAIVNPIIDYSVYLKSYELGPFVYAHIDGDKDYKVTRHDLEYCIDNLAENGLICQDDYGNNKWPTITHVVTDLVNEGKLKFVLVGDSSVWLTTPEYYDYWMSLLENDREFTVLKHYLGIRMSDRLNDRHLYYFINTLDVIFSGNIDFNTMCSTEELEVLAKIDKYKFANRYLVMPYAAQSTPGIWLKQDK